MGVGQNAGWLEGIGVGFEEGRSVGRDVGCRLGREEGRKSGCNVGCSDGPKVGRGVGVGCGEGWNVVAEGIDDGSKEVIEPSLQKLEPDTENLPGAHAVHDPLLP